MVFVNGPQPIIILESEEELLSNNSNICVIQSNRKWDQAAIDDLRNQIQLQKLVLYLHGGTNDAQTLTDDKNAQSELTKSLGDDRHGFCDACKYEYESPTSEKCINCINLYPYKPDVTDNWEAKDE